MAKNIKVGRATFQVADEITQEEIDRIVQMFTELGALDEDDGQKPGKLEILKEGETYIVRSQGEHDGELDDAEYNGFVGLAGMFSEHCFENGSTIVERINADGATMETFDTSMEMR